MCTLGRTISKISNLSSHLRKLEREGETESKARRRKERMRIRAEIHETENRKSGEKSIKAESRFFEKVDIIDKPLARENIQLTNIGNEREGITTDPVDIKRITKE